ncbi:MAG: DTW domain-containing protein [Deltaproteobacteria bacterium]|nr:DTW domain-containing protein [Deltaproteobacteria bacterium]
MTVPPAAPREPRADCLRCGRPAVVCWCPWVTPLAVRTRVVILQHPRERCMPIGTARMAHHGLAGSELHVGTDFDHSPRVQAALHHPAAPAILLYPGPEARPLETEPPPGPVTLVVIDGTWAQARWLFRHNLSLHALPRYALTSPSPSNYRIRPEPQLDFVCTIEALFHALKLLEPDTLDLRPLLAPFRAMVDMQLEFQRRRQGAPTYHDLCRARPAPPRP